MLRQELLVNWWYIQLGLPPVHWAHWWSVKIHLVALMIQQRGKDTASLDIYARDVLHSHQNLHILSLPIFGPDFRLDNRTVLCGGLYWFLVVHFYQLIEGRKMKVKRLRGDIVNRCVRHFLDGPALVLHWEDDTAWPEPNLSEGLGGGYMRP